MFKKLSNKALLGVLLAFGLIYLSMELFGGKSRSKSVDSEIASFEKSKTDKIRITDKKGQVTELIKEGELWKLLMDGGKKVPASNKEVETSLDGLAGITDKRLVSRDKAKWNEYEVDTAGTRLELFTGAEKTVDMVIGKFNFKNQREIYTYIRAFEADEVFSTSAFLGPMFAKEKTAWRDKMLMEIPYGLTEEISIDYAAGDSSFKIQKSAEGKWTAGGAPTDSATVTSYFREIGFLSGNEFADDIVDAKSAGNSVASLTVRTSDGQEKKLSAYQRGAGRVFGSTHNPSAFFSDTDLYDRIFKNAAYFQKKEEVKAEEAIKGSKPLK